MKKGFLKSLQNKADFHKNGIDYLRLVIKPDNLESVSGLVEIIERLDFDNSNFQVLHLKDHKLNLYKLKTKSGEGLIGNIVYNDVAVPILFFEKYSEHTSKLSQSWGRIDYYGMYFRMLEINHIQKSGDPEKLYGYLHKCNVGKKISRLDWKIDFFYNKETKIFKPTDVTKLRSNSKVEYKVIGPDIQSWRLGARKSKQYLIRGYDKLADTTVKGKFPMYKDYFKFKNVYRLEFEFLNHFCKKFTYDTIGEFMEHIAGFLNFDKSIGAIFDTKNNTEIGEVKDRFKYADSTKGYMKGCISNGINIFGLLEEVFVSVGKSEKEIADIFLDYAKRKKNWENMYDRKEDIEMLDYIYKIFHNDSKNEVRSDKE